MAYKDSSAYDNNLFFEQYMKRRHREESPNIIIEKPALLELIGDVNDQVILDLGCGDASLGIEFIKSNCRSYTGIDGSKNMYQKALQNLYGTVGEVFLTSMLDYTYPRNSFDIVTSQLAIHYIEDIHKLFEKVYETLKVDGRFIFSVQHPILTSSVESMTTNGKRTNWLVDHYFYSGKRVEPWIGEQVIKFHRTIEEYFVTLQKSGFVIEGLKEATPVKENFNRIEEYERRMRIPLFLLFSCRKPSH